MDHQAIYDRLVSNIVVNKKQKHLGLLHNKNDAIIVRLMAELDYWDQIIDYDINKKVHYD